MASFARNILTSVREDNQARVSFFLCTSAIFTPFWGNNTRGESERKREASRENETLREG